MQIPNVNLAASLTGIMGKTSPGVTAPSDTASIAAQSQVEQATESNPDRDAQGQGDGLNRSRAGKQPTPENDPNVTDTDLMDEQLNKAAPSLPDEPPSQLDLIG